MEAFAPPQPEPVPARLWTQQQAALDWHRLPSTRDFSSSSRLNQAPIARKCFRLLAWSADNIIAFASPMPIYVGRSGVRRDEPGSGGSNLVWQIHLIKPDMPNDTILLTEKESVVVSLDWAPQEYGGTNLLVATDRSISIWQRHNGLADMYETIILNNITSNDIMLARWVRPPSNYSVGAVSNRGPMTSLPKKFWAPRPDTGSPMDQMRDPTVRVSFVTFSSDGTFRWFTSTDRMTLSSAQYIRSPVLSIAEHKIKSLDAPITHVDTFFVSHNRVKVLVCLASNFGGASICIYEFKLQPGKRLDRSLSFDLTEGDPLVSRIDAGSLSPVGSFGGIPLTADRSGSFDIIYASWDSTDSDVIFAITKSPNEAFFIQRWEYRPVFITASDKFDWLVKLTTQSPPSQTNFKSWKLAACEAISTGVPVSFSQPHQGAVVIALADGNLDIRASDSLACSSFVSLNVNTTTSANGSSEAAGVSSPNNASAEFSETRNDKFSFTSSAEELEKANELIFICPSMNGTCVATLRATRELDLIHLISSFTSNYGLDAGSLGEYMTNLFELSLVKSTSWWDIMALLLAIHRVPIYANVFRVIIIRLMQDLTILEPGQRKFYWLRIEAIKSALYRCARNMEVNYINSQIRLQLAHAVEVARGLLRLSIQMKIDENPLFLLEDQTQLDQPTAEDKDSQHPIPTHIVTFIGFIHQFITKGKDHCLGLIKQHIKETAVNPTTPSTVAASPLAFIPIVGSSGGSAGYNQLSQSESLQDLHIQDWNQIENLFDTKSNSQSQQGMSPAPSGGEAQSPAMGDSGQPSSMNTPSGVQNPISPQLTTSGALPTEAQSPSMAGGASAPARQVDTVVVASAATILAEWPAYLSESMLPVKIQTFEQYFAVCDDSRHDVVLAFLFERNMIQLIRESILVFSAWCKVQLQITNTAARPGVMHSHRMNHSQFAQFDNILTAFESKLAEELNNELNDINFGTVDPSSNAVLRQLRPYFEKLANFETQHGKFSRSHRDNLMTQLDLSVPRVRFIELNRFPDVTTGDGFVRGGFLRTPGADVIHPSLPHHGKRSGPGAPGAAFQSMESVDVITKVRAPWLREGRICSGCNRVSFLTAPQSAPAPSASQSHSSLVHYAVWAQNWITHCPVCFGNWFYPY